jgi:acetyltransferase-like isoleucine patch superfamily enzyme
MIISLVNIAKTLFFRAYLLNKKVPLNDVMRLRFSGRVRLNIAKGAKIFVRGPSTIVNCSIDLQNSADLSLGEGVSLIGAKIYVGENSKLEIDNDSIIDSVNPYATNIIISYGNVKIDSDSRVRASIGVKYGGQVLIGSKTFINEGTELRCDNSIKIGSYTMISYEVDLFDTNTHSTNWLDRHEAFEQGYPLKTVNDKRPVSKPVVIGDNCWIGKRAAILKGVSIGDRSIVGLGAVVTHSVPDDSIAFGNPAIIKPVQNN